MSDKPRSSRLFVTRKLPWVLSAVVVLVYLATLNPWMGIQSLRPVTEAAGWSFEFPFSQPVHLVLGGVVARVAGTAFPLVANFLTALLAGGVIFQLARSAALLPHDRRHEERIREPSDIGLLTLPLAWVPPVLATLFLAFQYLFWLHATSYTREMLDLFVFAWAVRNLLEYRLDGRERRLWTLAVLVGIGVADNWAMIGFSPLFLIAVAWVRGMAFFNLGFLLRMFLAFLAGFAVILVVPVIAKAGGRVDQPYWELLTSVLGVKKTQILMLPRSRFLLLAFLMLLPLPALAFRWGTPSGTGIDRLISTLVWQLLKFVWFAGCLALALDTRFSPRQMAYGVPLLTFSYCSALVIAYVAGYYLLMGTAEPEERHARDMGPLGKLTFKVLAGLTVVATVGVPALLIHRNLPVIRAENGRGLADLALTLLAPVRGLDRAMVYSEDPVQGTALVAANATLSGKKGLLVVNGRLAPTREFRRFIVARHSAEWPSLAKVAESKENVAGQWLSLAVEAASNRQMFFTAPVFNFFAEPFDIRPVGSLQGALTRRSLLEAPADPAELQGIQGFWKEVAPTVEAVVRGREAGSSNSVVLGMIWSRNANASGVFFQRAGLLPEAAQAFDLALRLNPENAAAKANRMVNGALVAKVPIPPEAIKAWDGQTGLLDLHGPVDEPEFLRIFGSALLAQRDDLVRRAAIAFDRAFVLSPTNRLNRFGFITAAVTLGDVASATNALAAALRDAAAGGWTDPERARLKEAEGRVRIALGDTAAAEAPFLESRRLNPQSPDIHDLLSYLYMLLGRADDAIAMTLDWEKVSPPGDQSSLSRRALILMQNNKYGPAAETLTRILEVSPENNLARVNRAISRLLQGQLAEAKADYARLLKDEMETFQIRFGLAEVARLEKQPSEELRQLERYLELAPKNTTEFTNAVQRVATLRAGR